MSMQIQGTRRHRHSLRTRRRLAAVALALAATTALSGCFALPTPTPGATSQTQTKAEKKKGPTSVEIPVMLVNSGSKTGSVGSATVSIAQGTKDGMTVEVAESEVSGIGDSFRAAAWNAVIVATLLTGAGLDTDYRMEMHGKVDGPSAGGVSTVALLSLIRGDKLDKAVAMTGTITGSGTIGPVGGIPEKVQAIADDGRFTKALIPLGSRISHDMSGNQVDVIRLGKEAGIEVVEVGDVTQAYEEFTGVALTPGTKASTPKISDEGYQRFEVATRKQLTAFAEEDSRFLGLAGAVQEIGQGAYEDAHSDRLEAERLLSQGMPGGAFIKAVSANLLMAAITGTYEAINGAFLGDVSVLERALSSTDTTMSKITNYLDSLNSFKVKTLADAEALATSYGNGFDALTLHGYAENSISQLLSDLDRGAYATIEEVMMASIVPLLYLQIASAQIEAAEATFEIGRGLDGPPIDGSVDVAALGTFLRTASEANLEVFDSLILKSLAEGSGISMDIARNRLGERDFGVALAYSGKDYIHAVTAYLGEDNPNSPYAMIGHGWINYARNASLVDKYYSNGKVDGATFEITGAKSEAVLMHTIDFSRTQLSHAIGALDEKDYSPTLIVGAFESSTLDREGDVSDKFIAIEGFTGSYAMAKILAYLGGFPAPQ